VLAADYVTTEDGTGIVHIAPAYGQEDKVVTDLVRVRATAVDADVWHVVSGLPLVLRGMGTGLRRPKQPVPGRDVAGTVVAVGDSVTRFRPGDEVFGATFRSMRFDSYLEQLGITYPTLRSAPPN